MGESLREFGQYLSKIRRDAGFTRIRELGRQSGVSHATISRIENGHQRARPETLRLLAPYLGVEYEELMQKAGYLSESVENATPADSDAETGSRLKSPDAAAETESENADNKIMDQVRDHLKQEYGHVDPDMAKFLGRVITEVIQEYDEFLKEKERKGKGRG